jgi:hypothetical protein
MSPQESKIFKREKNCTFMLLAHLDIKFMCDIVITWQFTSVNVFICHLHSLTQDDGIVEQGFNIELCTLCSLNKKKTVILNQISSFCDSFFIHYHTWSFAKSLIYSGPLNKILTLSLEAK